MDDLPVYYTILWDPRGSGNYQFYDRTFYLNSQTPVDRVSREFVGDLFCKAIVVQVSFKII